MNRFTYIVVLCVVGCLHQGVTGVYYVTVETEPCTAGVTVFLVFRDRDMEPVTFYDGECTAVISVYNTGVVYEKEVFFDSSTSVGRPGGGITILREEVNNISRGDIKVIVTIKGRGEFRSEKKNVYFGSNPRFFGFY